MAKTQSGTVTLEQDGVKLDFTRQLPQQPSDVWRALTSPGAFGTWYNATVDIDPQQGGTFTVHSGPFDWSGKILAWEPEKEFKYEHNHPTHEYMPGGANTIVTWTVAPKDGGTELRFTQTGLPSSVGFAPGTHVVLDRLVAYVAGEEMPDFDSYFGEVEPLYPELNAEK